MIGLYLGGTLARWMEIGYLTNVMLITHRFFDLFHYQRNGCAADAAVMFSMVLSCFGGDEWQEAATASSSAARCIINGSFIDICI